VLDYVKLENFLIIQLSYLLEKLGSEKFWKGREIMYLYLHFWALPFMIHILLSVIGLFP
jgi:hypothetical protein